MRWKAGFEAPPFMSTNTAMVQGLKDLFDGTVESVPMIDITEAVAVQIYRLIFDKNASAAALRDCGKRGLYIILASFARGTRTEPPDAGAAERLYKLLGRPATRDRAEVGLAVSFRTVAEQRRKDPELCALSLHDARHRLYLRLDLRRLDFSFGEAPAAASSS
eukprot:689966-Prymnesium_polylepis.1